MYMLIKNWLKGNWNMIFNQFFRVIVVVILISSFYPSSNAFCIENRKEVLIIYNGRYVEDGYEDNVVVLRELLGRFDVNVNELSCEYYDKDKIFQYDYVFILNSFDYLHNDTLIEDLINYDKTLFWLGHGVDTYLERNKNVNLRYKGNIYDIKEVFYNDKNYSPPIEKTFLLGVNREYIILDDPEKQGQVYATLSDGYNEYPYIIREDNFWFVARFESYSVLFYILADVLIDTFNITDIPPNQVYIRIEDVHPMRDTKKLRQIGEYLNEKNIPFMIALIPAYKNPDGKTITPITEMEDFAATIRYLQELGGSVVLHGYTHQAFGGDITGEGFEFWDGERNQPPVVDMGQWVYERTGKGIVECVINGIYPLAFEAPHYAITQDGYREVKKYFSTYIGHIQTSNIGFSTTAYPYKLENTILFRKLIPENMGYIDSNNPLAIEEMFENHEQVSIVRGHIAGLFFHPYLDIAYLEQIVERLDPNTNYYDLRNEENLVKWESIEISSKNGKVNCNPGEYAKKSQSAILKHFRNITNFFMSIVAFFCFVFLIILIGARRKNKERLFG